MDKKQQQQCRAHPVSGAAGRCALRMRGCSAPVWQKMSEARSDITSREMLGYIGEVCVRESLAAH
jgi:hypothetical protein